MSLWKKMRLALGRTANPAWRGLRRLRAEKRENSLPDGAAKPRPALDFRVCRTERRAEGGLSGPGDGKAATEEQGLLVFHNTAEVIRAERILTRAGFAVRVMGPPPDLQSGCDMVLEFPLLFALPVRAALEADGLEPLQIVPLRDLLLEPVSLFQAVRYGDYLMVRAANVKMTVDAASPERRIVNVSGGGCPDVPYLASLLVGRGLDEADEPRVHGRTLCSYALQKAFEETRRLLAEPDMGGAPAASVGRAAPPFSPVTPILGERPGPGRSWLICGTVPDGEFPLLLDTWHLEGETLVNAGGRRLPVRRGTPALLASALAACAAVGAPAPEALLVGDEGDGKGSSLLYRRLADELLPSRHWDGLTFHYLFPDLDGHNRVLMALDSLPEERRPLLAADAGYMYVAKMSGYASSYDLFTPDAGELAFLADEKAPHPFYTRGFLLGGNNDVADLAARAAAAGNSARHLLIKGATDYVIRDGVVLATVDSPCVPALEPIGGTGDVVTGLVTALLAAGFDMGAACRAAARGARLVGAAARPGPASGVAELAPFIPDVVRSMLPSAEKARPKG